MLEIYHQFKILGLPVEANMEEITRSYREKAKLYHPDTSDIPDAKEKFIALKNAKNIVTEFKSKNIVENRYTYLKNWIKKINYYRSINKISEKVYLILKMNALCLKYSINHFNLIDQNLQLLFKGLIDEADFLNLIEKGYYNGKNVN